MAIDEQSRHQMYARLEEVLGPEEARTLMQHLPPVGWADVATKRDLEMLRLEFRADLKDAIQTLTFRILGFVSILMITLAGLAFAAAKLA
jgi:hypothetical protein